VKVISYVSIQFVLQSFTFIVTVSLWQD